MSDLARSIWVWVDSLYRQRCKGPTCGQTLTFARSCERGRFVPFNGRPRFLETNMLPDDRPGRSGALRQAGAVDASLVHFATCNDREWFDARRSGRTSQRRLL